MRLAVLLMLCTLMLCLCPPRAEASFLAASPFCISWQAAVVSLMSEVVIDLTAWSGDPPSGVSIPVLDVLLPLLTRGKLRVVPVESNEDTDGRCVFVAALELIGRRIVEYITSRLVCPSGLGRPEIPYRGEAIPVTVARFSVRGLSIVSVEGVLGLLGVLDSSGKSSKVSAFLLLSMLCLLDRASSAVAKDSTLEIDASLPRLECCGLFC